MLIKINKILLYEESKLIFNLKNRQRTYVSKNCFYNSGYCFFKGLGLKEKKIKQAAYVK